VLLNRNAIFVPVLAVACCAFSFAADGSLAPETIVRNYCEAQEHAAAAKSITMEMDIQASLPGLKKQGRFHALRKINPLGLISYAKVSFEGDNTVKRQVIERYLQAEADEQQDEAALIAVTPANYKFQYKGQHDAGGRSLHVFQVTPKKKRKGLFKGEIWIDSASFLPVRESGNLIKTSIFVKKAAFVRTFDIRSGIAVPVQVQSVVSTMFGAAELTVDFSNFALDDETPEPSVR
jgi:hypothetical protein